MTARKRLLGPALLLTLIATVLIAACGGNNAYPTARPTSTTRPTATAPAPSPTATTPPKATAPPTATTAPVTGAQVTVSATPTIAVVQTAVSLSYPKFTSNTLEVYAASTARFTLSSDQYDHTFTILALGVDISVPANSKNKAVEFAVPTSASGTYRLLCRIHESNGMVGTVQIAGTAKTNPQVGKAPASGSSGGGGTPTGTPTDGYSY